MSRSREICPGAVIRGVLGWVELGGEEKGPGGTGM